MKMLESQNNKEGRKTDAECISTYICFRAREKVGKKNEKKLLLRIYLKTKNRRGGEAMPEDISKDIIRGHVNAIILNILSQGDSYGYEISKTVKQLSGGRYLINEATLYTVFRRLEKAKEIESYWGDETQGGRRKYYRITELGETQLAKACQSWDFAKEIITALITGKIGGKGNE